MFRYADKNQNSFRYEGTSQALYGGIRFSRQRLSSDVSLRIERAVFGTTDGNARMFMAFLPNIAFQYLPKEGAGFKANYQKVLEYPGLYQLNPFQMLEDPNSYRSGNPDLRPANVTHAGVEYNRSLGKNFMSFRVFWNNRKGLFRILPGSMKMGYCSPDSSIWEPYSRWAANSRVHFPSARRSSCKATRNCSGRLRAQTATW